MTKKDYIKAAEIVRDSSIDSATRFIMTRAFEQLFASDNPRFDRERFRAACDPENPTIQARRGTKPRPARTGMDS